MNILEKLFGSSAKVRIMKMFLFHSGSVFTMEDIRNKTQVTAPKVRKEVLGLESIGFLKKKNVLQEGKTKAQKKVPGWQLDQGFPYLTALQGMLVHTTPFGNKDIAKKFKNCGDIKLLVVSGIFIQNWESRIDLLVVGDKLKKSTLQSTIKTLEADMGCELRYTILASDEFDYRMNIYDKLIKDVLDFPHEKIVNKIGI
ncbi:MAG: hypothetical protein ACQESA_01200 [Patescibacteria group bacterium]